MTRNDDDGLEYWHAIVTSLLVEGVAVGLFLACAFVWLVILSGRA